MSFLKALFGGKPSVEEKTVKYCKDINKAYYVTEDDAKAEKLEAERDAWYASLSEDDKKKSDNAREEWEKERKKMVDKKIDDIVEKLKKI